MFYPDPKLLIFKTKKWTHFFSEADFFDPMLSRKTFATNLNKLLFWMYGLTVIASVPTLNICQILMR